jgi:transposase-like protein
MGVKGFQKGHIVSDETRAKISKANNGNFFAMCDYCGKEYHTKKSAFVKRKRHFCCRDCYSKYRAELLPKEEQNSYGTGYSQEERNKRKKAREIFNHYVRDKHIEKQSCEICGKEKAEAHHDDYNKPLKVRWLCFECHRNWHKVHDNPELLGGGEE